MRLQRRDRVEGADKELHGANVHQSHTQCLIGRQIY